MRVPPVIEAVGLAGLLVVAACGGSSATTDDSSADTAGTAAPASSEAPLVTDVADTTDAPASSAHDAATTTTARTTLPAPPELADVESISTITITTPRSGNGERPLLAWEPLDGAADYVLVLTRPDGEPYWGWSGAETQIWLGGSTEPPPPDSSGPYLVEPMTLRVIGFDTDGIVVAASQPMEIAP